MAMSAVIGVESFRSIDISAALLQADDLKRNVYIEPPKDIKEDRIVWRLKNPLHGLNDAG